MPATCTIAPRHSWVKLGLDVRKDKLVRVRRCSFCHAQKTIPYNR